MAAANAKIAIWILQINLEFTDQSPVAAEI